MAIDDAINYKIDDAIYVERHYSECPIYHNQIADWLEELKEYRKGFIEARQKDYETAYANGFNDGCAKFSVGQDYQAGYDQAIDDAIGKYFDEIEDILHDKDLKLELNQALSIYVRIMNRCNKIAEQLKGGEKNE